MLPRVAEERPILYEMRLRIALQRHGFSVKCILGSGHLPLSIVPRHSRWNTCFYGALSAPFFSSLLSKP